MLFTVRTLGMDTVYKITCIHTLKSCKLCTVPKSVQFALPSVCSVSDHTLRIAHCVLMNTLFLTV